MNSVALQTKRYCIRIGEMSLKEAERTTPVEAAIKQEKTATADYLEGRMPLDKYQQVLKTTFPLTKLDLRKLASDLGRHS